MGTLSWTVAFRLATFFPQSQRSQDAWFGPTSLTGR